MRKIKDLQNKKFGRLLVLRYVGKDKIGNHSWLCRCDCNKEVMQSTRSLTRDDNKNIKSCGCLRSDINRQIHTKPVGESACRQIYNNYKRDAKYKGRTFNLTFEEARRLFDGECFYCGIKPSKVFKPSKNTNGNYTYNGIDRIDSSIGYICKNVVSACSMCNYFKLDHTLEDFTRKVKEIYENMALYNTYVPKNKVIGNWVYVR